MHTRHVIGLCILAASGVVRDAASENATNSQSFVGRASSGSSALALASFNGALVALVADNDDAAVHVFETNPPREIAVARLPGTPSDVLVTPTGQVIVSLRDKGQLALLEARGNDPHQLVQRGAIDTGGEPIGLAVTPDGATLVVTSGWTHEVLGYTLADHTRKFRVDVGREPRGLVLSSDGSKAFVTHASGGAISVVDLANGTATSINPTATSTRAPGRARSATQGFAITRSAGKVFAPVVMADPTTPETYYGAGLETMSLLVVDEGSNAVVAGTNVASATYPTTVEKCILPRSITVVQGATTKVAIACAGENNTPTFDTAGAAAGTRRSGDLPTAIVFDGPTQKLVAWSQMTHTLSASSDPTASGPTATVHADQLGTPVLRGRGLFYDVSGHVAADGRACASCHTDGRDDGLVWSTPEGARQTPMLAGRVVGTAPYGWTRNARTFSEYVTGTITRLHGSGFSTSQVADLEAYVVSLKPPHATSGDATIVERGHQIFASQGCGGCHSGAASTDNASHPINGTPMATPSLRFVTGTAPYFHDGRYSDLRTLLTGTDPDMGRGRTLASTDLDALETYLRSL